MSLSSRLKVGDWVEIRSKEEILATLDERGEIAGLPFMPEMLQFCGGRFQVFRRAHKTCDTVDQTGGMSIRGCVHLDELRCDGSAHGGCEADCLLFWKDEWMKPASGPSESTGPTGQTDGQGEQRATPPLEERLQDHTRVEGGDEADPVYVCQATRLPAASTPLPWWHFGQYWEDLRSGNVGLGRLIGGFTYMIYSWVMRHGPGFGRPMRWVYDHFQKAIGGFPHPRRWGTIPMGEPTPTRDLGLQPGELARVRSYPEILETLNVANKCRGLFFDAEEVPHCEREFPVKHRVNRIINEKTGQMIHFKTGAVILEGAWCGSRYSEGRLFCPRAIPAYWREIWLERVEEGGASGDGRTDSKEEGDTP